MSDTLNSQVLILPINNCAFSAGYKNQAYLAQQTYNHYGVDLYSNVGDKTVYACGDGEVVACGWDGVVGNDKLGNVIAIIYKNVKLLHDASTATGKVYKAGDIIDVTCRMFHFDSINVKVGDKVTKDTVIGMYGNTGSTLVNGKKMGKHLHIEFDVDTEYPTLTFGVKIGGNVFNTWSEYKRAGEVLADSTINPSYLWSLDYNQSIKGIYSGWYTDDDINLPKYSDIIANEDSVEEDVSTPINVVAEGIDVSFAQGSNIDFEKVKKSGKNFIFIRLGYSNYAGGINEDFQFKNNITKATKAGMDIGVYVYAYDKSIEAAKKTAKDAINMVKNYKITYPIAYDIEDAKTYSGLSKQVNTDIANAFLNEIEANKYYSILYSYVSFCNQYLDMEQLATHDTWIAYYGNGIATVEQLKNIWNRPFGIFQYAGEEGTCDGVSTACDLDYAYKDYPAIIKAAGLNNLTSDENDITEPSNEDMKALINEIDSLNKKLNQIQNDLSECKKQLSNVEQERDIAISENKSLRDYIYNIKTDIIDYGNSIGEDGFSI